MDRPPRFRTQKLRKYAVCDLRERNVGQEFMKRLSTSISHKEIVDKTLKAYVKRYCGKNTAKSTTKRRSEL